MMWVASLHWLHTFAFPANGNTLQTRNGQINPHFWPEFDIDSQWNTLSTVTDTSKPTSNIISFTDAGAKQSSGSKPRHVRKQEARMEKAKQAEANRVRTGRTKLQKAQEKAPTRELNRRLEEARRDRPPDD